MDTRCSCCNQLQPPTVWRNRSKISPAQNRGGYFRALNLHGRGLASLCNLPAPPSKSCPFCAPHAPCQISPFPCLHQLLFRARFSSKYSLVSMHCIGKLCSHRSQLGSLGILGMQIISSKLAMRKIATSFDLCKIIHSLDCHDLWQILSYTH